MSAVISCVTENCNCSAWSIGCIFTGNMFGKIRREIKNPKILPIPLFTESGSFSNGIPKAMPAKIEEIRNAMKASTLK